jgi:hypothetical protein
MRASQHRQEKHPEFFKFKTAYAIFCYFLELSLFPQTVLPRICISDGEFVQNRMCSSCISLLHHVEVYMLLRLFVFVCICLQRVSTIHQQAILRLPRCISSTAAPVGRAERHVWVVTIRVKVSRGEWRHSTSHGDQVCLISLFL